jgi:transcriptional regulator with XRE-family HTH domain/tetratricopeptide (TPR) repeat protein
VESGITLFGTELRRRRTAAGLSLTGLAALVHYSRSHMSKVETSTRPPSADLARRCDSALSCHGELAALAGPPPAVPAPQSDIDVDEVWVLSLDDMGVTGFQPLSRRRLLAVGGIAGLEVSLPRSRRGPRAAAARSGPETVEAYRSVFDRLRGLGQTLGPDLLVPTLVAQTHALRTLAESARPTDRNAALSLAARYAEYTGWMEQEAGDDARAAWWTDKAVAYAAAAEERDMAAYALVRRGLIALYRHDATQTVQLARRAQQETADPRIRGLAAQREAQGLAVAGDYDGCQRALDQAALLLAQPSGDGGGPVVGTSNVADPAATATGWCLFDLGYPARAAEVLRRECARIPHAANRTAARYGARLALALAASGEPEEACAVADRVLDRCAQVDSATIRMDLRALARELNRWHARPQIRDVRLRITNELSLAR